MHRDSTIATRAGRVRNVLPGVFILALTVLVMVGATRADGVVSAVAAEAGFVEAGFADDVLPIFEQRCVKCHGGVGPDGEQRLEVLLDLSSYEGVMAGSEYGTVIEPGDSEASLLIEMIVAGDMPSQDDGEEELVPPEEIELIRAWIDEGAENN